MQEAPSLGADPDGGGVVNKPAGDLAATGSQIPLSIFPSSCIYAKLFWASSPILSSFAFFFI